MSHPIVENKKPMVEFAKQREKAKADHQEWKAENAKAHEAYAAASAHALSAGGTIPQAPQDPRAGAQALQLRLDQIKLQRDAWLKEHAEELIVEMLAREDEIVADVAKLLETIDAYVAEMGDLLNTVRSVYGAVHGVGTGNPFRSTGTSFALLLTAARRDTRMLREPYTDARLSFDAPVKKPEAAPEQRRSTITAGVA